MMGTTTKGMAMGTGVDIITIHHEVVAEDAVDLVFEEEVAVDSVAEEVVGAVVVQVNTKLISMEPTLKLEEMGQEAK